MSSSSYYSFTFATIAVVGTVANCCVLVCVIRNRAVRKSRNYILVVNMTMADLCFLLFVTSQDIVFKYSVNSTVSPSNATLSHLWRQLPFNLFHCSAVASLVALNIEKFYYIYSPFNYEFVVTRLVDC